MEAAESPLQPRAQSSVPLLSERTATSSTALDLGRVDPENWIVNFIQLLMNLNVNSQAELVAGVSDNTDLEH